MKNCKLGCGGLGNTLLTIWKVIGKQTTKPRHNNNNKKDSHVSPVKNLKKQKWGKIKQ